MQIIGRTVQVTAQERTNRTTGEVVCRGEDHGRLATVVGWTRQPEAPKELRWLVSVRLDDGQTVNYRTTELAFEDGAALPLRPDIEEDI